MADSSGGVYYLSPSSPLCNLWLVPVGASLFSLLYTVFVMAPDIKVLLEKDFITQLGIHQAHTLSSNGLVLLENYHNVYRHTHVFLDNVLLKMINQYLII